MKSQPYTIIPTEKFNKELHQQILYIAMQFSKETAIQVKENIQNSISNLMNHPYISILDQRQDYVNILNGL